MEALLELGAGRWPTTAAPSRLSRRNQDPELMRRALPRPIRAFSERPVAFRLAGRCHGQLVRCPRAQGDWLVRIEDVDETRSRPARPTPFSRRSTPTAF
jgi:hypothetical protein